MSPLYNNIYKIISNLIARILLDFLSGISLEQFGFLKGKQFHKVIGIA
jgi:hypothetical protein